MEQGTLIEFRHQGDRRLAVAQRPEGKKDWIVEDETGQTYKIRPQRAEYLVKGVYRPSEIAPFRQQVESYTDPDNLELAWEILVEASEAVTPQALAELIFDRDDAVVCYAAHQLLSQDKIYFKKKGDVYEPRSAAQVQEIKHQIRVEQERQQEQAEFLERIKRAIAKEKIEWTQSDRTRLEILEKFVLYPENHARAACDLLTELGKDPTPGAAFELLVNIKWWSKHENLFLRRSSYPLSLPKKVLEAADAYLQSPPPDPDEHRRLDLTGLKTYTIDDESTREIDDGLSIQWRGADPPKIWIHIADPTRLVSPGDELDLEARRRSTSLYLPTGMIPMFPPQLATGPMSLVQGKVCHALSFGVVLDETGAVLEYSISPSRIKPTYRLTYEDVDQMLDLGITDEPEILELSKAAELRQQWRASQGSIRIQMPESTIKVNYGVQSELAESEPEITIEPLEPSQSRQLVAEMMILAGEIAGRYCQEHSLPVPFRSQPQPELPPQEELILLPAGPVRFCALRRCMPRSEISITPARHASLGLDVYSQATSPIRRYTDLLTHFQIKAHLRQDSLPFTADELLEIVYSVGASAYEATMVERQTNRYWSLEYLRRHSDHVWQGLVLRWLREDDNLGIILLEELGLELPHRFEHSVQLGDRLGFQVTKADPGRDEIRFREWLSDSDLQATAT